MKSIFTSLALNLTLLASTPLTEIAFPSYTYAASQIIDNNTQISKQKILRETLKNGLRVVIIKNDLAPVVTAQVNYLVGSNHAPKKFPGTAHALEHMMFRGSKGLDKDQLAIIEEQLGGSYNAFTTEQVTQYYYTAPAENLDVILKIEAMRMNGLNLNAKEWEKERGAIEQEVSRDLSNPVYKYISKLQKILFKDTPYEHDALGTRPSFKKTTVQDLRRFYETYYTPNNAILVICGDIDPQKTLETVKQNFSILPHKTIPKLPAYKLKPLKAETLHFPTDLSAGLVTIAWRMPGEKSKDYAATTILSDVISSQRAKLFGLVPQGKALMTDFEYIPKGNVGFGVAIAAFPKNKNYKVLLNEMQAIVENFYKNGVPAELVEAAKHKEIASLNFSANSITGLASSWSNALAFQGLNNPDDMITAFNSVTSEKVNQLARQILNPQEAVTAILTPENSGKPLSNKGFGGAETFSSIPEKPIPLPDWADKALKKINLPKKSSLPADITLENGIRLIVQPVNVSNTVSVYGHIRQNPSLQEDINKESVSDIIDEIFKYGTKTYDRLAFRKQVDDIAADINAGSDFSLSVLTPYFDRALQLLADNELNPSFKQENLDVVKQQTAQSLIGLYQSPGYHFSRSVKKAINPPNDPSLRQPNPAKVMKLTLQDLKDFYHKSFRPDLTTIVIVGNITPNKAKATVEKYFSSWKTTGSKPNLDLPQRSNNKTSYVHVPDKTAVQNSVTLVESLPLNVYHPDHYALNLGNEILSGGFAGRLYKDLRVKTGYVYNVDSSFDWSRTRASYSINFGADPNKVILAHKAILKNLYSMQTQPVSEHELQLAKASLLRNIPLQRASVDKLASQYLLYSQLDLPLDTPQKTAKIYYQMNAADIQKAFKTWIRIDDLAEIIKGPATSQP